jgi:ABC-2 type transport system ATP-binding protein
MKRRLDLAVTMIERPALLFLDEPTTGLDPRSREQVWATVTRLVTEGVTILLTTQYLEEADRLAHAVGVLDGGRIVAEGSPNDLKSTVGAEKLRLEMADQGAFDEGRRLFPNAAADPALLTLSVTTDGSATAMARLLDAACRHHLDIRRVDTLRPSLDDVFLALTDHRPVAA